MNVSTAIETRRSIKHYDPTHRMTEAEIEQLMSLALLSPTAFNIQNWRFVLVQDPELRKQVRAVSWDQAQVTDASLLVVLVADLIHGTAKPRATGRTRRKPYRTSSCPPSTNTTVANRKCSATKVCAPAAWRRWR